MKRALVRIQLRRREDSGALILFTVTRVGVRTVLSGFAEVSRPA